MKINTCRVCKRGIKKIIDYGKQALVGTYERNKKNLNSEKKFPLTLNFCQNCSHVQIKEILEPNILFKNYAWETGVSKTNISIITNLSKNLKKKFNLNKRKNVLEIASNDGSLLDVFRKNSGCEVVGVDPAKNFKQLYKKKKIDYFCNYFNFNVSKKIKKKYEKFDFILARNVIAHVPNPNEIFKGAKNLLKDNGIFIVEFPSLLEIYKGLQYDNVFHEHVGYHSLKSINDLANKVNLQVFQVEIVKSQGTSLRCYLAKKNFVKKGTIRRSVKNYLKNEKRYKIYSINSWIEFSKKMKKHSKSLKDTLKKLKEKNFKISAYGASGKGSSLMQFAKIDKSLIDIIYDRGSLKINRYSPGTHIRILHPRKLNNDNTDYLLLITWNLKKEVLQQNTNFIKQGGRFIIPFPVVKILK